MNVAEIRELLGLGEELSNAQVIAAYAVYLAEGGGEPEEAPKPISLVEARRQLKMEEDDDSRDEELSAFIDDAIAWVERYTGHLLTARDVAQVFSGTDRLRPRAWPVKPGAAVTVQYEDAAGEPVTIEGARISTASRPAIVRPAAGTRWPLIGDAPVTVIVRAGYEPDDVLPGNLRRAALVLIQGYEDGGEDLELAERTARGFCASFRARTL